ncbi:MAG: DUF3619 family protein [Burkholderiales bacterium]|jgi:hypothetical protein|nr:DUF3619 family protein [Burkholderiales bacterium]
MMEKEDRFGWQVRQWLNRSAMEVTPSVQNRLELARKQALMRQRKASKRINTVEPVMTSDRKSGLKGPFNGWFSGMGAAMPALAVAFGLFFLSDAQMNGEANRLAEIDSLVLGDELPISAYLDEGFSAYLKQAKIPEAGSPEADNLEINKGSAKDEKIDPNKI